MPAAPAAAVLPAAPSVPAAPAAAVLPAAPRFAPPVALYVHVPFCVSHCPYCDFVVYAGAEARGPRARLDAFTEAVRREIDLRASELDARIPRASRSPLRSVYVGGGTPSLLASATIARLIALVGERFGIEDGAEITLEANPAPDERGDLRGMAAAGVTRLSIGAQSMDAGELRRLGRRHSPADVAATVEQARNAGIGSVSLDLLYDVPGQTEEGWRRTLDAALALRPDHLSLYALTLDDPDGEGITGELGDHLPTPAGARRWRDRARLEQDDDRAAGLYEIAASTLAAAGWRGYEISNWARPGHESRHNLVYWRRLPHEAVGPGAHAFDGEARRWNAARLDRYLAALVPDAAQMPVSDLAPSLPPGGRETLTLDAATAERVILGLRLDEGLPASLAAEPPLASVAEWALRAGLLERVASASGEERICLTIRGRLLSNELFSRLV